MAPANGTLPPAEVHAREAGLVYVTDQDSGIRRVKRGSGFGYAGPDGTRVSDSKVLTIRSMGIPPAWTDVWICHSANGHIQATGRDARGRKQYQYHVDFRKVRDATKFDRMVDFAKALGRIRAAVSRDMKRRNLSREKVVATIVHLLDNTLIRVGNVSYARENRSFGLTTLRDRHATIDGSELRFVFAGKSGRKWQVRIRDRRVASIVRSCQELPGQHLFQYIGEDGEQHSVGSGDVNAYLHEATGMDVTAKDFRTWNGTVLAAVALSAIGDCEDRVTARTNIKEAIDLVAKRLGNTPAICRKCYVHPAVLESYLNGDFHLKISRRKSPRKDRLQAEEAAVLRFLRLRSSALSR